MNDKTLLKLALIVSLLGLTALFLTATLFPPQTKPISEISLDGLGSLVKIQGTITKVSDQESVLFLTVTQPEDISVIVFKNENHNINVQKNQNVEIIGKVEEYEGEVEIIADKIRILG